MVAVPHRRGKAWRLSVPLLVVCTVTALTCSTVTLLNLCDEPHSSSSLGMELPRSHGNQESVKSRGWAFMRSTVNSAAQVGVHDAEGSTFQAGPSRFTKDQHDTARRTGASIGIDSETGRYFAKMASLTKAIVTLLPRALHVIRKPIASTGSTMASARIDTQTDDDTDGDAGSGSGNATDAAKPNASSTTTTSSVPTTAATAAGTCRRPFTAFGVALTFIFSCGALALYLFSLCLPGSVIATLCCLPHSCGDEDSGASSSGEDRSDADAIAIPSATTAALNSILDASDPEQVEMMKERVILLDAFDNVIGSGTKKKTHLNALINNADGLLHRAFSVFMFDKEGRLLLQKRAAEKVTFPHFWANTCCSHPLHVPTEIDGINGVRNAARRKLLQELGIPPEQVPKSCLHFLTRVHYRAPSDDLWGEHEIDYVVIALPPGKITVAPNANEVAETRWVDPAGLASLLHDDTELVSPWFRAIEGDAPMLHRWWNVVRSTNGTSLHALQQKRGDALALLAERSRIHRDVSVADVVARAIARGDDKKNAAKGRAALVDAASTSPAAVTVTVKGSDASKKQGAYGKIPVHVAEGTMIALLKRPRELCAALALKSLVKKIAKEAATKDALNTDASFDDVKWANSILKRVSRSFSTVIAQLPDELRLSVCLFYLALRGLDTVEDDMDLERFAPYVSASSAVALATDQTSLKKKGAAATRATALLDAKTDLLRTFYHRLEPQEMIQESGAGQSTEAPPPRRPIKSIGEGAERELVEHFTRVADLVATLPAEHADVIADVTKRMGEGMADYIDRDLSNGTNDVADYDRYCTIVAGFVGEGLTKLFSIDFEPSLRPTKMKLSHEMGMFLQKVNIIRDYLEDAVEGR